MRLRRVWFRLLCGVLVAGSASAGVVYQGNGFTFFEYNGVVTNQAWNSTTTGVNPPVDLSPGVGSWDQHFQQYAGGPDPELMDGYYTHGVAPFPGGDPRNALQAQVWDNEQLFWNLTYSGGNTGVLNIGIVTGFNSNGVHDGSRLWRAGDLFLAFGRPATDFPLPDASQASNPDGQQLYDYAVGVGSDRIAVNYERRLTGATWEDSDSNPFDVESDPYRVASGGTAVDFASVDWTEGAEWNSVAGGPGNVHNFLAVQILLDRTNVNQQRGGVSWLDYLLNPASPGLTVHWTYECGNDTVHHTTPVVPVPAAAPIALLGMGIVALVSRKRRTIDC